MSSSLQKTYQTRSAILFITFNRPDVTSRVFEQIKQVKPQRLYVSADGPRSNNKQDEQLCAEVKNIIKQVDWDCEVKTLYSDKNLGCKIAVSSAIDWFFDHEEEGIVLEDDCLPVPDFFEFCDLMLERYRLDTRIRHIAGTNVNYGEKWGDGSYYFSNQTTIWGWATWRRVWKDYDVDIKDYNARDARIQFEKVFADKYVVENWMQIFTDAKEHKVDTWDNQLAIINIFNDGFNIIPNYNLVSNIGFRGDATHTVDAADSLANLPLQNMPAIIHPSQIAVNKAADLSFLRRYFKVEERIAQLKKHNAPHRRVKRWFKGLYKKP